MHMPLDHWTYAPATARQQVACVYWADLTDDEKEMGDLLSEEAGEEVEAD